MPWRLNAPLKAEATDVCLSTGCQSNALDDVEGLSMMRDVTYAGKFFVLLKQACDADSQFARGIDVAPVVLK